LQRSALQPSRPLQQVRQNPDGKGVYIESLTMCQVASLEETMLAMKTVSSRTALHRRAAHFIVWHVLRCVVVLLQQREEASLSVSHPHAVPRTAQCAAAQRQRLHARWPTLQGAKNRAVGRTEMNEHSSRSHSIISVYVVGESMMTQQPTAGRTDPHARTLAHTLARTHRRQAAHDRPRGLGARRQVGGGG
jgi:hypothetical protein